ncbi:L,D-transpeptidase family protein [Psychrobacter sp. APC 3426]|uniref:L,D-transpeptidase family protein n=1 Tax=Psychrobacter sp. APC 3426 TaxID=3035177 RepID=UPI0025B4928F|nr:L,D-transpeptidase family protein [Psychrobacter sp. APC 3426]MDN3398334.1 L,D-transpeptidase family protein [Psychrobacter sp. APC 3426]
MSFFNINSKYSHWLFIVMGFSLAIMTSTSAIAAEGVSENKQAMLNNIVIDKVFVDKSARTLQLLSDNTVIKSYHIALGGNPVGHKQQQGDKRTPTGSYTLDYKNEKSKFYRSIHVSYPNTTDKARAKSRGVSAGGDIMIHGQKNGFGALGLLNQQRDWTEGCIAVTNDEMDEIMAAVKVGTPIEIVE